MVLSIPGFYLLYTSNRDFKKIHSSTDSEIKGEFLIGKLLNDLSLLGMDLHEYQLKNQKAQIIDKLVAKNYLNLKEEQFKNANLKFNEFDNISLHLLPQHFYLPLISFVGNYSNLILDPDTNSYYLMDILVFRLPRCYAILANANINNQRFISIKDQEDLQSIVKEIEESLNVLIKESRETKGMESDGQSHLEVLHSLDQFIKEHKESGEKITNVELIMKLRVLETGVGKELRNILSARNRRLENDRYLTIVSALGFWIMGTIFGFFLFKSILENFENLVNKCIFQEKQLLESEKLSFIGEIANAIAHEVKSPLSVINLETSMLKSNIGSEKFNKERSFLRLGKIFEMSTRIDKISSLINIFTRKSENDPLEIVTLEKIFEDVIYLTQLKSLSTQTTIYFTSIDCDLECRAFQLEQVFINLVNNSLDAIENLSERWIKIIPSLKKCDGEDWIAIKVMDSGMGIKKEVVQNMFNSFFTTKIMGKGTGVGLSITQRIVEDHRGRIYYDEHAEHTTFVVEIPVRQ